MSTDTDERLKELYELSSLYDLYGSLLNEHSRQIFEDYVFNDLSLSEIASEVGMSRQGVRDIVVRTGAKLKDYELKLGFLKKLDNINASLEKVQNIVNKDHPGDEALLKELKKTMELL